MFRELQLATQLTDVELQCPEKSSTRIRSLLEALGMQLLSRISALLTATLSAELCTGTTREEMSQPAFAGMSVLSYPDLHEDSIPQLHSLRACSRMMEVCGIDDFSIKGELRCREPCTTMTNHRPHESHLQAAEETAVCHH